MYSRSHIHVHVHLQYTFNDDRVKLHVHVLYNLIKLFLCVLSSDIESSLLQLLLSLALTLCLFSQYYEAHSFLRDEETVSAMKQLLAGVSQISFNITVDTASLEFAPAPEALQPALRIRAPLPMEGKAIMIQIHVCRMH